MADTYSTDNSWMDNIDLSNNAAIIKALDDRDKTSFNGKLGITFPLQTIDKVVAELTIAPDLFQPFGFLHGGVTLALIEAAASKATDLRVDFSKERPFGIHIEADHKKPGRQGVIRATATLDHVERNKYFWKVVVTDEEGDVMTEAIFITKIVSLERLAQKEAEREGKM